MGKGKRAAIIVAVLIALAAIGRGIAGESTVPARGGDAGETQEAAYELTPEEDLGGMQIGQTAVFEPYEVTLESVEIGDDTLTATITVRAHGEAQSLKAKFLKGGSIAETSFEDGAIELAAGGSATGTITYSGNTLTSLTWDNWGHEATWTFENAAKDAADAAKRTSQGLEAPYAWQAVEAYGAREYPYGFDLNWWTEKLAEDNQGDSWYLKATVDIRNENGKKAKHTCEAVVEGTNEDPQVTYFIVY
ncbi:hypothetical protein EII22_08760 [Coriobacteriales bacterium OH1046]|nr:hypothetical protein EII22_08760 [Coriobacteriales bacterium OH1046]